MRGNRRRPRSRFQCPRVKKILYIPVHLGLCVGVLIVVGIVMVRHHGQPVPRTDSIW